MLAHTIIDVVIADDHPMIRAGVAASLQRIPSIRVIGSAANSTEIIESLSSNPCNLLITDFSMPGGKYNDGFAMLSYIRSHFQDLSIIIFTGADGAALTNKLLNIGISAIVNKSDDIDHLVSSVRAVAAGTEYLSPSVTPPMSDRRIGRKHLSLTKNEIEVLRLYLSGMSIGEIAVKQHRTKQTVSAQKINAMHKLGAERDIDLFQIIQGSPLGLSEIFNT